MDAMTSLPADDIASPTSAWDLVPATVLCATEATASDGSGLRPTCEGMRKVIAHHRLISAYAGWVFVTWAAVDGLSDVYYKRVTVMVRFPSPVGGISRLVAASAVIFRQICAPL